MGSPWASRVALIVGLTVLLAALLSSSGRLLRQPRHVTTIRTTNTRAPVAPGARVQQVPAAALEETLGAVRGQVGSLRTLVARTQAASLALKERLRAAVTEEDGGGVDPSAARSCPDGCERHGNCNALTGECSCSLTHRGAACEVPTMPACELDSDGHVINLSLLASESFWCAARAMWAHRAAAWARRVATYAHDCGYRLVCVWLQVAAARRAAWRGAAHQAAPPLAGAGAVRVRAAGDSGLLAAEHPEPRGVAGVHRPS